MCVCLFVYVCCQDATTSTAPKLREMPFPAEVAVAQSASLTCRVQAFPLPSFRCVARGAVRVGAVGALMCKERLRPLKEMTGT